MRNALILKRPEKLTTRDKPPTSVATQPIDTRKNKTPLNNKLSQHRKLVTQKRGSIGQYELSTPHADSNLSSKSRLASKPPRKLIIYNNSTGKGCHHVRTRSINDNHNEISLSLTKTFFNYDNQNERISFCCNSKTKQFPIGSLTALNSKRHSFVFNEERDSVRKSKELLSKGKESIQKKDYNSCIGYLNGSIECAKNNYDAIYLRGVALYETGQFENAIVDFQKIVENTQNYNKKVYIYIAQSHIKMGAEQKAIEVLDNCLLYYDHFVEALTLKAQIFIAQKKFDNARENLKMVLSYEPNNSDALMHTALCLEQQKFYNEALSAYKRVKELSGYDKLQLDEVNVKSGSILYRMSKYDEAYRSLGEVFCLPD